MIICSVSGSRTSICDHLESKTVRNLHQFRRLSSRHLCLLRPILAPPKSVTTGKSHFRFSMRCHHGLQLRGRRTRFANSRHPVRPRSSTIRILQRDSDRMAIPSWSILHFPRRSDLRYPSRRAALEYTTGLAASRISCRTAMNPPRSRRDEDAPHEQSHFLFGKYRRPSAVLTNDNARIKNALLKPQRLQGPGGSRASATSSTHQTRRSVMMVLDCVRG
jgi:hypothetical protein